MYMTRVNMVGDKEKCRLSPFFNFFSILFLNDGTTANTKPGSDKDCMQHNFGLGITMQFSSLLLYHNNSMLS